MTVKIKRKPPLTIKEITLKENVPKATPRIVPLEGSSESSRHSVDLRAIMSRNALGQVMLVSNTLDIHKRRLLMDILADDMILNYGSRPSKSTYLAYAHAITELYTQESVDTYYIPSVNGAPPRGKLYSKVNNFLTKRRQMEIVEPSEPEPMIPQNTICLDDLVEVTEESYNKLVNWLRTHSQPHSKVVEFWRTTAKRRLQFIHDQPTPSLGQIWQQWPRYKDKSGYLLICEDFALMYPDASERMSEVWPQISAKLLERLQAMRAKDKEFAPLLQTVRFSVESKTPLSPEVGMGQALLLLPLLLPEPTNVTVQSDENGRKRRMWTKPSVTEAMENFISIQQLDLDLDSFLHQKAASLALKNLHLQPHVVVLADDVSDVHNSPCYAVIHDHLYYQTHSLLQAVDVCMKAMFVLGIQFPASSVSSWTFLQKAVYNLDISAPRTKVLELISDVVQK